MSDRAADFDTFQSVVRNFRANEGDSFAIHIEHTLSNHGRRLVHVVPATLDDA